jgi:hypothetical protein
METRDFYLTAYLMATGLSLKSHRKMGNITQFEFADTEEMQAEMKKYYDMKALVNPVHYGNALKNLKSIIHSTI